MATVAACGTAGLQTVEKFGVKITEGLGPEWVTPHAVSHIIIPIL